MASPISQNLFSITRFSLVMPRCPMFSHFAQQITIPSTSLDKVDLPTRAGNIGLPGDVISFDQLTVTANLDMYWLSYEEVHNWMRGMAAPYHSGEWMDVRTHFDEVGIPGELLTQVPDLTKYDAKFLNSYSTAEIMLKTGSNTSFASFEIDFMWPTDIQLEDLTTTASEGQQPMALSVVFDVSNVTFNRFGNPWD